LQKNLESLKGNGDVSEYFEEMMKHKILGFIENNKIIGFVSFRENYLNDVITSQSLPNIYLSTLILSPSARGMGLTQKAYAHLFNELYPKYNVYTRTWSTNFAHVKILGRFDFTEFFRIKNDRGESIDTVYFEKIR
jgi:ribosomal protein S18 acetylase RimI-like enzyme